MQIANKIYILVGMSFFLLWDSHLCVQLASFHYQKHTKKLLLFETNMLFNIYMQIEYDQTKKMQIERQKNSIPKPTLPYVVDKSFEYLISFYLLFVFSCVEIHILRFSIETRNIKE